jgi:hypothetical protein
LTLTFPITTKTFFLNFRLVAARFTNGRHLVSVRGVVQDGAVLVAVGRERRRQLLGRDAVPLGAKLLPKLPDRWY